MFTILKKSKTHYDGAFFWKDNRIAIGYMQQEQCNMIIPQRLFSFLLPYGLGSPSGARYPGYITSVEESVFEDYKLKRSKGGRVTKLWIKTRMKTRTYNLNSYLVCLWVCLLKENKKHGLNQPAKFLIEWYL